MDAADLLHRLAGAVGVVGGVGAPAAPPVDEGRARSILEAAARQLELFGIQRTTMDDVARRAGVSRVTIYRHYATKDALVEAVVLHEVRTFLDRLGTHLEQFDSDEDRMVEGFAFSVTELRGHTLMRRLLEGEPELFLPQLTTGAGPLIAMARTLIVDYAARRFPDLPPDDAALGAEIGIRLMISLVLTPEGVVDLHDGDRLRELARRFLPAALRRRS